MPARHRCLCQSRPIIWLNGLFIQLKRGGLIVRRLFTALRRAGIWLAFAMLAVLKWVVTFPPKAVHWLWTSLFWPTEESVDPVPPRRKITNLHRLNEGHFVGPSWWERISGWVVRCGRAGLRAIRIGHLQLRRMVLRARLAFREHTAWSLATVTGSLGILLMIAMQLMYSFQTLGAKESPVSAPQYHTTAKTRIDPGFPQLRAMESPESEDIAQIDPFAPAQPDPSATPQDLPRKGPETPAFPEPLDQFPPLQPMPAAPDRQPPREAEPFVDPLDNLPPFDPRQSAPEPQPNPEPAFEPYSPVPSLPTQPQPPAHLATEPPPNDNSPIEPPSQEPQIPIQPIPEVTPPRMNPEQFVDPLDNYPQFPSEPRDAMPPTEFNPALPQSEPPQEFVPQVTPLPPVESPPKTEPTPVVDPLDNLPKPIPDLNPNVTPMPTATEPIQTEPNPFVDPLDNLPPLTPQPNGQRPEPPPEFAPEVTPMPPVEFAPEVTPMPPTVEPNPFVDPLGPLPPQPKDQRPASPPEFAPEVTPRPNVESRPKVEPNPFVDPLDNLPPLTPIPNQPDPNHPVPSAKPPEREPILPRRDTVPPADLGIGFQRLPMERDERFRLESNSEYRRESLSREIGFDAWERYLDQKRRDPVSPRPYSERISLNERRRLEQDLLSAPSQSNYEPLHQNPRGELNVEIAKTLPLRSTAHEPLKYEIVVENRGREMIETVDVDEAVPPTHLLTDVNPMGHFENNLLRWRLRDLRPGEQRRLEVEVVPSQTGTIETTTSVRPSRHVAAVTEVAPAIIRLRRSGYRTIALEETVLFTNHVQNLSNTTQRNVSIVEEVPKGYRVLRVEDGGLYDRRDHTITWNLASLPAGKIVKLDVRLQAESTGELVSRVTGSTREGKAIPILARVLVDRRRTGRTSSAAAVSSVRRVSSKRCSHCGCPCRCTAFRR